MVNLGQEAGALIEQLLHQESDLSHNPNLQHTDQLR